MPPLPVLIIIMRLFEAIIEANHRAAAGDKEAGLRPADFADSLPVAALTCIDPRINPLVPEVLGIPEDQFIWLRNAGNIITGPISSTMRSLALACAVKNAHEIAIIGHTDCQVAKTTTMQLLERLKNLGIERHLLPDNVNDYFGMFSSERQNIIKACEIVRQSPLIGPKVPVHGLLLDIHTGKLEWLVNGYEAWGTMSSRWNEVVTSAGETVDKLKSLADFHIGEMKFPETKIGETVTHAGDWLSQKIETLKLQPQEAPPTEPAPRPSTAAKVAERIVELADKHWPKAEPAPPPPAKKVPLPPPIRPKPILHKGKR
jgi:carbonic anhydrase